MIQVEGLTKQYGSLRALDQVTFDVSKGEILGFLGPNGAGKTTTMRILTGYMPPNEGKATIAGFDVVEDSLEVRRRVGYLPETVPLYREMTVRGYLDFVSSLRRVNKKGEAIERVLETCDIADVSETLIANLSKGYRQRVGLAQALVHDPEVLVLDEPTIGLDPRQILSVRELIKSLSGERTVILSTHILPEVSEICERVLIINRGRIVAEDSPEHLTDTLQGGMRVRMQLAHPPQDVGAQLGALNGVADVSPIAEGIYDVALDAANDRRAELSALAVKSGWGLLEMHSVSMTLEEIFLELTTEEHMQEAAAASADDAEPPAIADREAER